MHPEHRQTNQDKSKTLARVYRDDRIGYEIRIPDKTVWGVSILKLC